MRARTWKVCWPLLTVVVPMAKVSPKGALISDSTWVPSTRNWIEPGSSSTPSPLAS